VPFVIVRRQEHQKTDVLKRRKAGQSLRSIAKSTSLSLQTVRTIIDKPIRKDRATSTRLERITRNRLADAAEQSNKRIRDGLPSRATEMQERGADLIKRAKGLR
jgi:hypothetical protein